jgi:hypothetical protein
MFFIAVNHRDKDGIFSIGQTLRIRVGPLKGYLCRVLAIRHSDVTVKLDSQHKVLTGLLMMGLFLFCWMWFGHCYDLSPYVGIPAVKSEHLSEVRGKSSTMSLRYSFTILMIRFDLILINFIQ